MHNLTLKNITLMQDNAPIHFSKYTKEWMRINKVKFLDFPRCSPDLNPIENLWEILDQKLRKVVDKPQTKDQLWNILEREWYSISKDIVRKLYTSIPERIDAVRKNKGGYTKY